MGLWLGHSSEPLSISCHNSWQLLQSFEDIPLCSILQQIQEKHDLQKVKKVRVTVPGEVSSLGVENTWFLLTSAWDLFLGNDETCSFCKPVWGASPLSVGQAGEGKSFGGMGYVDWVGSGGGQWRALLIPSAPLWVPGLGGTDEVREATAGPGPALQPLAGAAPEGPGGHPL